MSLPNSDHWSLVVDYSGDLAAVVGFSEFLAEQTGSPKTVWQAWLTGRIKKYVADRFGQTERFWSALRKYDGVVSGSAIALVCWSNDLLPDDDPQSPASLGSDLDIYVPDANSKHLRDELLGWYRQPTSDLKILPDAESEVFSRDHNHAPRPNNHPYNRIGWNDLASVSTLSLIHTRRKTAEFCMLKKTVDEPDESDDKQADNAGLNGRGYGGFRTARKIQIIGLESKNSAIRNQADIVQQIESSFDFAFLANSFDGQALTILDWNGLLTKTGPNRRLLKADDDDFKFKYLKTSDGQITADIGIEPTNTSAARILMRIAKYMSLGCTVTNLNLLTDQLPADSVLPNGLPRFMAAGDCDELFSTKQRYQTSIAAMVGVGVRVIQDIDGSEVISQTDYDNLKRQLPTFCNRCETDRGRTVADGSSYWPVVRGRRFCLSVPFCGGKIFVPKPFLPIGKYLDRFRQSKMKGICAFHFGQNRPSSSASSSSS